MRAVNQIGRLVKRRLACAIPVAGVTPLILVPAQSHHRNDRKRPDFICDGFESGGTTCLTLCRLTHSFFTSGESYIKVWRSLTRRNTHKTDEAVLDK